MPEAIETAERYIEKADSLTRLRERAASCTACDLYAKATATVFGEGAASAKVMLIGEQPGDAEDREGRPFVGPAGKLLDRALVDAGIDRRLVYVTNVVKHFKWVARGKKRIHQKPNSLQIESCRPWLDAELDRVSPKVVVALGSTAAQALFGSRFRVTRERGTPVDSPLAETAFATIHPSAILRMPDRTVRDEEYRRFVGDLRVAAEAAPEIQAPRSK